MGNQKSLFTKTQNNVVIKVSCYYNPKTNDITISTYFNKRSNKSLKGKSLYSITTENISTRVFCDYNLNTDHITISSGFYKNPNNGGSKTNPNCSSYLGIHIAERVLSKIFKNVERMSVINPGYDFICNKNYKIDVKSATMNKKYDFWKFSIKKNKIADYFLCLAFDNRYDLNPQYLWLIPSELLNSKTNATISKSTLQKWKEYEKPIDEVISCCDILRDDR